MDVLAAVLRQTISLLLISHIGSFHSSALAQYYHTTYFSSSAFRKQLYSTMSTPLRRAAALATTTSTSAKNNVSAKLLGATRTMAGGKEIRFGVEGRAAMLRGVDLMADAVQVR